MAGVGIEDTTADPANPLHDFDTAVARMQAAAAAARGKIVLTGRTDNYLNGRPDLDDTIRRLTAFAEAGADVLYAPGLPDLDAIRAVGRAVAPKPINVLMGAAAKTATLADLSAAGVRRISLGGALYRTAMTALVQAAQAMKTAISPSRPREYQSAISRRCFRNDARRRSGPSAFTHDASAARAPRKDDPRPLGNSRTHEQSSDDGPSAAPCQCPAAIHLKLDPLHKPLLYNLRELWIDPASARIPGYRDTAISSPSIKRLAMPFGRNFMCARRQRQGVRG